MATAHAYDKTLAALDDAKNNIQPSQTADELVTILRQLAAPVVQKSSEYSEPAIHQAVVKSVDNAINGVQSAFNEAVAIVRSDLDNESTRIAKIRTDAAAAAS